jgi:hypothetical protein
MKNQSVFGIFVTALMASMALSAEPANRHTSCLFQTRSVVLTPDDLTLKDWPERVVKAGLTTVALHLAPSTVEKCVDSLQGKAFLEKCSRLGLNVEFELHAVGELLPRNLFASAPDCFRMNEKGGRRERGLPAFRPSPTCLMPPTSQGRNAGCPLSRPPFSPTLGCLLAAC